MSLASVPGGGAMINLTARTIDSTASRIIRTKFFAVVMNELMINVTNVERKPLIPALAPSFR
ncbi:hypothetical protein D3C86_2123250 [compost metagenome]